MPQLKCPNCGTTFKVDETNYAAILAQVRTEEFDHELHERLAEAERRHVSELKNAETRHASELKNTQERYASELEQSQAQQATALDLARAQTRNQLSQELADKDQQIAKLQADLKAKDAESALERQKLESDLKSQTTEAKAQLEQQAVKSQLETQSLREKYESALQLKDEEIERLKDLKSRLSTKMVGETLEQHCENEFNRYRATGFQNAYFEKDNEVSKSGSKGDFIFRDFDENGTEIISIMFDMKNENETTATKHKNEDFLKELDKDRREKGCEYAILVSLLEADSELYNTGIVDVSHRYPKMYVIRPQFFIPMITLLRNSALNSLQYKNELVAMRNQDIDITNFEQSMTDWKTSWFTTMKNAGKKHIEAIEQIDKAIKSLEKTRDALILSNKHLDAAENKLDALTIKRLTRGNPTMAQKFADLKADD